MALFRRHPAALAVLALAACDTGPADHQRVAGGDADAGRATVIAEGCGACHTMPGIRGARGTVGPPLEGFAQRGYIAGQFPNEPAELMRWLADPPAVLPGTAMPATGLSAQQQRDVAAFLYAQR
ncbi:MAG: c-type cytochrome [Rhodospirillaceae bacterium]